MRPLAWSMKTCRRRLLLKSNSDSRSTKSASCSVSRLMIKVRPQVSQKKAPSGRFGIAGHRRRPDCDEDVRRQMSAPKASEKLGGPLAVISIS